MKKIIALVIVGMFFSSIALAFCTVDFSCKMNCKRNCRADGYNYMTCERLCDNMCQVCN